ncbi:unnamed protein product [Mesocestoides corti]|uniref:Ribosome biogenesis protein NOP53 n=1 Tax=Mesocestoides corti TaxID=53468 RepID=A0A0R3UL21_MESCO|nr:unnamed protein product [Mesocestoides corti]
MHSASVGSKKRIDVNGVSLIDLKAEIARRQNEVKTKATTVPNVANAVLKRAGGGSGVLLKRPPSPPSPPAKSRKKAEPVAKTDGEDDVAWKRARRRLEAKSRLYEALKQAAMVQHLDGENDDDKAPLVDFERKAMEQGQHLEEKRYNTDSSEGDDEDEDVRTRSTNAEPVSIPEGPVTYAHLRQGEIRDHGTGFYAFSADAEKRAAEQAALRELRRRTERARKLADEERLKRAVAMGKRLARLRARKGLPDVATAAANLLDEKLEDETDQSPAVSTQSEVTVGEQLGSDDLDIASMLRRLRDEAEIKQAAAEATSAKAMSSSSLETAPTTVSSLPKKRAPREWDRGKTFIPPPVPSLNVRPTSYKPKAMEARNPQFAPPDAYR